MIKKLLIGSLLLLSMSGYSQESRITGVVTYFFNDNYGDRPDTGSKVYVIESTALPYMVKKVPSGDTVKLPKLFKSTLDTFDLAVSYRAIYANYKIIETKRRPIPQDVIDNLKKYNVDTDDKFSALDKRVNTICFLIEFSKTDDIQNGVADGSGNFNVKVKKPGTYYVFVRSNHRKGNNLSTVIGKIECQEVSISENDEKTVSINFRP